MNVKEFIKLELAGWKKFEIVGLAVVFAAIFTNAILFKDNPFAVISAICGILYTIIAGKGKISCYAFGIAGSGCYGYISFINGVYGNFLLYVCYYIPMDILGIFKWKKNLKSTTNEIKKTQLTKKELIFMTIFTIISCIGLAIVLNYFKDSSSIIDSVTTVLSVVGMYLTVKRCIEQWILWIIVNSLSLIMWIKIVAGGVKAYATLVMWATYVILAIYFYIKWHKELKAEI